MVQKLPAARGRHLSWSACGVISSHFLTWQGSRQWHFQHHLEDQEIQSGWQHQRWAWSDLLASLYARNEGNGEPWAVIPRCCREFLGRLTDDLHICKLFKIWFAWIWKEIEKKIQRGGELSFLSYCNYTHEMKRNVEEMNRSDWNSSYLEMYFPLLHGYLK